MEQYIKKRITKFESIHGTIDTNESSQNLFGAHAKGEVCIATDKEIFAIAQLLDLKSVDDLFHKN